MHIGTVMATSNSHGRRSKFTKELGEVNNVGANSGEDGVESLNK